MHVATSHLLPWVTAASLIATLGACTLTTSFSGLTDGPAPDGGAVATGDAAPGDAAPGDAGLEAEASTAVSRSCKELKTATPSTADGFYRFDPDGSGPLPDLEAYCDMTTADGGWTLVARTVPSGTGMFGWNVRVGDVRDQSAPFSLGVDLAGVAFSELLVGVRGDENSLVGNAYRITVGGSLTTTRATSELAVTPVSVLGTCTLAGGPGMLRFVGYTHRTDNYFFRDVSDEADVDGTSYGLYPDGFRTRYNSCSGGGNTNGKSGLLFVR